MAPRRTQRVYHSGNQHRGLGGVFGSAPFGATNQYLPGGGAGFSQTWWPLGLAGLAVLVIGGAVLASR